uniref:Junctional sarcoplasmic reticulum protein 1 n=1 Tax=Geotrypetes seraphini TaxID=260995 RepID=A0A6P8RVU7_GEOSA|nr:junctional sarcoplasmic reticulum protein 1 [Geotrypetes seraphini]XP_033809723.1 junctional sarcoplasmic reticulum protein 1 [Geotrypetes seraphini]XP_033809724.1 junctional sarcoplasmic reticulum protein 1 [Geotrypetes seraphini]
MEGGTNDKFEKDAECPKATEKMPVLSELTQEPSKEERSKGAKVSKSKKELSGRSEEKEPKKSYELQITEDLDEFVESVSEMPKATRKKSLESKADSKTKPVIAMKKIEPSTLGPVKEDEPWEGVTLNKCLIVASFVALLSMGFQILQDAVESEDEVLEADTILWTQPESSPVEDMAEKLTEPWFFESWFDSSEEEPEVIDTEAEEILQAPAANTVLKETEEKAKSPENKTEEDKAIPAKLKQTHKLEKSKLQKAPKRDLPSQEDKVKSSKIWKPAKEKVPKKEDKHFSKTQQEGKARLTSRVVKGKPFLKSREGKPHYPKNSGSDFKHEHRRLHKAQENNSHDYRTHKEHKDYRRQEHKSGKPFVHDRVFSRKDKPRHEESKSHD